jgi:hypothetical protein
MPNDVKVKDMSARANKVVKNRDDFLICAHLTYPIVVYATL